MEIKDVQLTPPLVVTTMTSNVQPGKSGIVTVRLEKPREKGEFQGTVAVNFRSQPSNPLVFEVVGKIVPPIEFDPLPMFFVSTQRGQNKTASIEIINHEHGHSRYCGLSTPVHVSQPNWKRYNQAGATFCPLRYRATVRRAG